MKYFLSDFYLEENETQESIKNRIASRLSLPASSFHYEILLKESVYSSSKLHIRSNLCIETNEFIRDTSLSFWFENKPFSFIKAKMKNRPIVYGATLSGLYAALYLSRCGLKPIIVDPCSDFSISSPIETPSDPLLFGGFLDFPSSSSIASFLKEDISSRTGLKFNNDRYQYLTSDMAFCLACSLKNEVASLDGEFYFSSSIKNIRCLFNNLKSVEVKTPDFLLYFRCDALFASLPFDSMFKDDSFDVYLGLCLQNKIRDVKNSLYGNYRTQSKPLFIKHPDKYSSCDWIDIFPIPSSLHSYYDVNGHRNIALKVKRENALGYYSGLLLKKLERKDIGVSKDFDEFVFSLLSSTYREGNYQLPCSTLDEFLRQIDPYKMGPIKGEFDSGLFLSSLSNVVKEPLVSSFSKKLYESLRNYPFFYSTNSVVSGFSIYKKLKPGILGGNKEPSKCKGIYCLFDENDRPMDASNACFNGLSVPFECLSKQG